MHEPSLIQVNFEAVTHNMTVLRRIIGPDCKLCPIVKADGYGLGGQRVGGTLAANGADMLAVYTMQQAADVLRSPIDAPVLILMPVYELSRNDEVYRALIRGRLHLTVHDDRHLDALAAMSEKFGCSLPLHLEVDTGMGRSGCRFDEAPALLERIAASNRLVLMGIFSHFASAGDDRDMTETQAGRFTELLEHSAAHIPHECIIHLANTAATISDHRFHQRMVRVGIAWIGYGPERFDPGEIIAEAHELLPAVTWTSRVIQIKSINAGDPVGYGSRWTAERPSRIGLIPVGYADGYPAGVGHTKDRQDGAMIAVVRRTEDGAVRQFCPVIGRVNMDQITIDLTDLVDDHASTDLAPIEVGTPVELISPDIDAPNHLPRLAGLAGTHSYDILTHLNPRIRRTYYASPPARPAALHPAAMGGEPLALRA